MSIIHPYIDGRSVCSATHNLICEDDKRTASGARYFDAAAPKNWHELPEWIQSSHSLPSFKKKNNASFFLSAFYNLTS